MKTTTTKTSTGAGTSELFKSKTDPQGGCLTHTHNETHTNRHDAHATSLTRDAAKRVMGYIVGRIGKAKSSERKSVRERVEGQNKTHFCCRLALCPQQQPLQIQLKAMHDIQMRRRAATLRFGCRAEYTRSQSARTRARTRVSRTRRAIAGDDTILYLFAVRSLSCSRSLALSCLRGPPQSGLFVCESAARRNQNKTFYTICARPFSPQLSLGF